MDQVSSTGLTKMRPLFLQRGLFDQPTAKSFRSNILEKGDSEDPMVLYRRFRGGDPDPDALLKARGLK